MLCRVTPLSASLCTAIALFLGGCSGSSSHSGPNGGEDHAHASTGPHGGSLIELGEEEYHAELVHDEANGTVTVFLLDSAAKAAVPIDATEITINLKHGGRGEQFKLAAAPDSGDTPGKASRFASIDKELATDLDREDAGAQLALTINGKPYRGDIKHDHDHE